MVWSAVVVFWRCLLIFLVGNFRDRKSGSLDASNRGTKVAMGTYFPRVEQYDDMVLPSIPIWWHGSSQYPIWQWSFVQPWQPLLSPRALKLRQGTKQESLPFPTVHITMGVLLVLRTPSKSWHSIAELKLHRMAFGCCMPCTSRSTPNPPFHFQLLSTGHQLVVLE